MAKKNILIKKKNGTVWDELYPITNASNVKTAAGRDAESVLAGNALQSLHRQALINGSFDIWQRGTTFNAIVNNGYSADRWQANYTGTTIVNVSRQAFALGQSAVPNNPKYFFRYNISAASGQTMPPFLTQQIEGGVEVFAGKTVTLSLWAKADSNRQVNIIIKQHFGTGTPGSTNVDTLGPTLNLTTSWQYFTYTATLPSIAGKTFSSNNDPRLFILFQMPQNTICTIDFAQIQFCASNFDLPFQPKGFNKELVDCMRYFQKSYNYGDAPGTFTGDGTANPQYIRAQVGAFNNTCSNEIIPLGVPMRTRPTVTPYSPVTGANYKVRNYSTNTDVNASADTAGTNEKYFCITFANSSAGQLVLYHWTADAEL